MISDGPLHAGERRIVNDRGLFAAPGIDMAVDRVEAGVADPVRKPAAVDAGVRIEHGLRLLEPVDVGRRLAPKTERIALPARVDLVIAARTGVHDAASKHLSAIFDPTTTAMQERRASPHSPQDFRPPPFAIRRFAYLLGLKKQ